MAHPDATPVLSARGLTVTLRGDAGPLHVLDAVDLDVCAGETVDVVGPSGSGKSTLLRALAKLMPQVHGELLLGETPDSSLSPQQWRAAVALLPQKPAIVDGSVLDNLMLPWTLKVRTGESAPQPQRLRDDMDAVGLGDVALDRLASRLSVGQQARLAFVRVLLTAPRVLLLDEADAALDDASAQLVSAACASFASHGGAIVRVRHRSGDGLARRRLRLANGTLAVDA